jgi:hypothetical protein
MKVLSSPLVVSNQAIASHDDAPYSCPMSCPMNDDQDSSSQNANAENMAEVPDKPLNYLVILRIQSD